MKSLFAVALFGLALALVGCGDDDGDDDTACSTSNPSGTCSAGNHCDAGTCMPDEILITISGSIQPHPASNAVNNDPILHHFFTIPSPRADAASDNNKITLPAIPHARLRQDRTLVVDLLLVVQISLSGVFPIPSS